MFTLSRVKVEFGDGVFTDFEGAFDVVLEEEGCRQEGIGLGGVGANSFTQLVEVGDQLVEARLHAALVKLENRNNTSKLGGSR